MRSFTLNRFPIKTFPIDSLLISHVKGGYLNTDMRRLESPQKDESRA